LKKGTVDIYYFNKLNELSFSWEKFDSINDFKASCKIDRILHKIYGEIDYIESIGEKFIINGVRINKKMNINQMNNDIEKWNLTVELSEFIILPKDSY